MPHDFTPTKCQASRRTYILTSLTSKLKLQCILDASAWGKLRPGNWGKLLARGDWNLESDLFPWGSKTYDILISPNGGRQFKRWQEAMSLTDGSDLRYESVPGRIWAWSGFLKFCTADTWASQVFVVQNYYILYLVDTAIWQYPWSLSAKCQENPPPSIVRTKDVSKLCQISPKRKIALKTTGLETSPFQWAGMTVGMETVGWSGKMCQR